MISLNYNYPYYNKRQVQQVLVHPKFKRADLKDLGGEILNEMFESIDNRICSLGHPPRNKHVSRRYTNWCNQLNLFPVTENLIRQLQRDAKTMEGMSESEFTGEYILGTKRKQKPITGITHFPVQVRGNITAKPRYRTNIQGEGE